MRSLTRQNRLSYHCAFPGSFSTSYIARCWLGCRLCSYLSPANNQPPYLRPLAATSARSGSLKPAASTSSFRGRRCFQKGMGVVLLKNRTVSAGYLSPITTPKRTRTRSRYTAEFKTEVALAALTERQPLAELAAHHQLAAAQSTRWKLRLRQQANQVFTKPPVAGAAGADVEPSYAAIGQLQREHALLKRNAGGILVA